MNCLQPRADGVLSSSVLSYTQFRVDSAQTQGFAMKSWPSFVPRSYSINGGVFNRRICHSLARLFSAHTYNILPAMSLVLHSNLVSFRLPFRLGLLLYSI